MKKFPLSLAFLLAGIATGAGVILFDTGDPSANTTAPGGALAGSGWQYEGDWDVYLGTPIAPNFFITADHVSHVGVPILYYHNALYRVIGFYSRPGSDLRIWKVAGTFADFAPLYTKRNEVGQHLVVFGRGTQRGTEVYLDNTLRGWNWGPYDATRRWGENDINRIEASQGHDLLYATFDQHVLPNDHPNESHLSSGDSGGAVFLNDGGVWKLAGINSTVDELFTAPPNASSFAAAIFDGRGYYTPNPNDSSMFIQVTGLTPVPTGFYASRISSELAWIGSALADPQFEYEPNQATLTYWRLTLPSTEIVYEVQQSTDLVSWTTATSQDEIVSAAGGLQQIKAKVDPGGDHVFLRVKVTRPPS
jgi:hypothetical protein